MDLLWSGRSTESSLPWTPLRFFTGVLEPVSDWPEKLATACKADFGGDQ